MFRTPLISNLNTGEGSGKGEGTVGNEKKNGETYISNEKVVGKKVSFDAIDSDEENDKLPRRGKRTRMPASCIKSPNFERVIKMKNTVGTKIRNFGDAIFLALSSPYDIIFSYNMECYKYRVMFESLIPGSFLHVGVIDAWSCILNYEEKFKSHAAPNRVFCHTRMISKDMIEKKLTFEEKFLPFSTSMTSLLEKATCKLVKADLVFFPIIWKKYFYLLCFNMKTDVCYLMDNIKREYK